MYLVDEKKKPKYTYRIYSNKCQGICLFEAESLGRQLLAVADLGAVRGVQLNPPFGRQLYIFTDICMQASNVISYSSKNNCTK